MKTQNTTPIIAAILMSAVSQAWAEDPQDLVALQDSYLKARNQALAPINKKYMEALSMMKVRYTKEGNLEAALAVDSKLKNLQQQESKAQPLTDPEVEPPNKDVEALVGEWRAKGEPVYKIFSAKKAQHGDGPTTGVCEVKDRVFTIQWSNGWRASIALGQRGDNIEVKYYSPNSSNPSTNVWSKVK